MSSLKNRGRKTITPLGVGIVGVAFIFFGVLLNFTTLVFIGLCAGLITLIMAMSGETFNLSDIQHKNYSKKEKTSNPNFQKESSYIQRVDERKSKRKDLERQEKVLKKQYEDLKKDSGKELSEQEKILRELEGVDLEGEEQKQQEAKVKMQEIQEQLKEIQHSKEILQEEENEDYDAFLQNLKAEEKEKTKEKEESSKKVLSDLNIFQDATTDRYFYISLEANGERYQLLADEKLKQLEKKYPLHMYKNARFRNHCCDVRYNDLFFECNNHLVSKIMVDGVYTVRNNLRIQLCNGKLLNLPINLNTKEAVNEISQEFANTVLNTSLISDDKIEDLNKFSAKRLHKMQQEYSTGVFQAMDYIAGNKII